MRESETTKGERADVCVIAEAADVNYGSILYSETLKAIKGKVLCFFFYNVDQIFGMKYGR